MNVSMLVDYWMGETLIDVDVFQGPVTLQDIWTIQAEWNSLSSEHHSHAAWLLDRKDNTT